MAAPPVIERHRPHFHQRQPILEPVRCATTANIAISTALNNGDTLDGITLATGDRVLVKDQSTGSQNGIYEVGAIPQRAYDLALDEPNFGFIVFVREGTTNGGTRWQNTNTTLPTIDTTALTFATAAASTSFGTPALTLSTTNAGGVASTAIRTDATIAIFDATVPVTQAFSDTAATGSAAVAARRDHKHGMPAASGATFGTPAIVLGTAAANGSIDEAIRRDSTIVAFDATAPVTQALGDTAATGSQAVAARRDHTHGMPAAAVTTSGLTMATGKVLGRTTASTGAVEELGAGTGITISGGVISAPGGGGSGSAIYPLDTIAIDGTYGDQFDASSLNGRWTLRNFVTGDLSFQQGVNGTYIRFDPTGQAVGDGVFQTDPGGDITIAAKIIQRGLSTILPWGICMIDSNGTGVSTVIYNSPVAVLLTRITTYSTYQGTYVEIGNSGTNPNVQQLNAVPNDMPVWVRIRVSGTNFILSYSLDGELWSHESGNLAATFTRNRMGFIINPLGPTPQGDDRYDIDWFNKL